MILKPLRQDLELYIKSRKLLGKWQKAVLLFQQGIKHPSLRVELLEPKWRALFFFDGENAEVFKITNHYV